MNERNVPAQPAEAPADLVDRRRFGQAALGAVGVCYAAALGYPVYRYLASPVERAALAAAITEVTLKDAANLALGTARLFKFGARPAMLIHHKDGAWVAFDAVCTHLGCTVEFQGDKDRIHCACHGGVYDARSGANVSGPPPRPLRKYQVKVSPEGVVISRA